MGVCSGIVNLATTVQSHKGYRSYLTNKKLGLQGLDGYYIYLVKVHSAIGLHVRTIINFLF